MEASSRNVEVQLLSPTLVEALLGETVVIEVQLENRGTELVSDISLDLDLPYGLTLSGFNSFPDSLAVGEVIRREIRIIISPDARIGSYLLKPVYTILSGDIYESIQSLEIIIVDRRPDFALSWVESSVAADVGETVTARFVVENNGTKTRALRSDVVLPDGWKLKFFPQRDFELAAGETRVLTVVFQVGKMVDEGRYVLYGQLFDEGDEVVSAPLYVDLAPLVSIVAEVLSKPEIVIGGEVYTLEVLVRNMGNVATTADIIINTTPVAETSLSLSRVMVPSGETKTIDIRCATDELVKEASDQYVTVTFRDAEKGNILHRLSTKVTLIPSPSAYGGYYKKIPSYARIIYRGNDVEHEYTAEVSGSGSINDDKTKSVEYKIKGPAYRYPNEEKLIKETRAHLRYDDDSSSVICGDTSYRLSRLLQSGRYGRGAEGTVRVGDIQTHAYFVENTPDRIDSETECGLSVGYWLSPSGAIYMNVLETHKQLTPDVVGGHSGSVSYEYRSRAKGQSLTMEYGQSKERSLDRYHSSYGIYYSGTLWHNVRCSLQRAMASPFFVGSIRDSNYFYGSLIFPFTTNMSCTLSYNSSARNLHKNDDRGGATGRQTVNAKWSYKYNRHLSLSAAYRDQRYRDHLNLDISDNQERWLQFSSTLTGNKKSLQCAYDRGRYHDFSTRNTKSVLHRFLLFSNIEFKDVWCSCSFTLGHNDFSLNPLWSRKMYLSFSKKILKDGNVQLYGEREKIGEMQRNVKFGGSVSYRSKHGHQLRATVDQRHLKTLTSIDNDTRSYVQYTFPFGLPYSRDPAKGTIKGSVYIFDGITKTPGEGVLLRLGERVAVSGKRGEYSFVGMSAEEHLLWVDRIPPGYVSMNFFPEGLFIPGKRTTRHDITLVKEAVIEGSVIQYAWEKDGEEYKMKQSGSIGGLTVYLQSLITEKIMRTTTNTEGSFTFKGLVPGQWKLVIRIPDLQKRARIEEEEQEILVTPGEHVYREIKVIDPKPRKVRMLDKGKI